MRAIKGMALVLLVVALGGVSAVLGAVQWPLQVIRGYVSAAIDFVLALSGD